MALLFEFVQYSTPGFAQTGTPTRWQVTDAHAPQEAGIYQPEPGIQWSGMEQSSETVSGDTTITCRREFDIVRLFVKGAPLRPVWLYIRQRVDDVGIPWTLYKGRVVSASTKNAKSELRVENALKLLRQTGPDRTFQPACDLQLYSPACGANRADYLTAGILASVSSDGLTVTSPAFATQPDGYFVAGDFEASDGQARTVIAHAGDTVTLLAAVDGLAAGSAFVASKGCDRSPSACRTFGVNHFETAFTGCPNIPNGNLFETGVYY